MENVEQKVTEDNKVSINLEEALKDQNFSKQFQSYVDSQTSKAVEAFKQKGFVAAVEKEVETRLKAKETKTPEQIKFEEYEAKLADMQNKIAEKERLEMRIKNKESARTSFIEAKLPEGLLDFLVSEDAEKTKSNIEAATKMLEDFRTDVKKSIVSGNNIDVPGKTVPGLTDKEPGPNATKEEWKAYYKRTQK